PKRADGLLPQPLSQTEQHSPQSLTGNAPPPARGILSPWPPLLPRLPPPAASRSACRGRCGSAWRRYVTEEHVLRKVAPDRFQGRLEQADRVQRVFHPTVKLFGCGAQSRSRSTVFSGTATASVRPR